MAFVSHNLNILYKKLKKKTHGFVTRIDGDMLRK